MRRRQRCREFWIKEMPVVLNRQYEEALTVFFTDATNTGCGQASAQTGPLLPGRSQGVLRPGFTQLQDTSAPLATATVHRRHEYGHHIQNPVGINEQMQGAAGRPSRQSVPGGASSCRPTVSLACGRTASDRGSSTTRRRMRRSTPPPQLGHRIQQKTQGRVDPESFTHGTAGAARPMVQARLRHRRPQPLHDIQRCCKPPTERRSSWRASGRRLAGPLPKRFVCDCGWSTSQQVSANVSDAASPPGDTTSSRPTSR